MQQVARMTSSNVRLLGIVVDLVHVVLLLKIHAYLPTVSRKDRSFSDSPIMSLCVPSVHMYVGKYLGRWSSSNTKTAYICIILQSLWLLSFLLCCIPPATCMTLYRNYILLGPMVILPVLNLQ